MVARRRSSRPGSVVKRRAADLMSARQQGRSEPLPRGTTPAYSTRPRMIVLRASLVADAASTRQIRVGRQLMIEAAGLMIRYYAAVVEYPRKGGQPVGQKDGLSVILKLKTSLDTLRREASQRVVLASGALQAGGCRR